MVYGTDFRYVLDCLIFAYHTIISTNVLYGRLAQCMSTYKQAELFNAIVKSKKTKIKHESTRG
jgi:hypothetical protein